MPSLAAGLVALVVLVTGPHLATQKSTTSRIVFNEFTNLTDEQTLIMAYNYTQTLFTPNSPIPTKIPTTLAFDPQSPLRHLVREDQINPLLRQAQHGYPLPTQFDFHSWPAADILAPLYRHEQEAARTLKLVLGRRRDPHLVDKEHMSTMLENVFTLPRHSQRNSSLADSIGQYIMRKFGRLGLLTGTQVFHISQFQDMFWEEGEQIDEGSNIIGIYPGEKFRTPEDRIIVVGAHWDTTGFTDGYNDNGSGLAAMLEIARALTQSSCRLRSTVIFVAFDKEEVGSQGSHEFVRSYLVPEFFSGEELPQFQGAFVLDTIMNYNDTAGAQLLPDLWRTKIPAETFAQVEEDGFRGDFISLVSRSVPEKELADLIEKHWNKLSSDKDFITSVSSHPEKFKLRRYTVDLSATMPDLMDLTEHIHFLRSDHARFWYSNETGYQLSLRSVLFTDTGPYRGVMARCYHRDCDSVRIKNRVPFASYEFLAVTAQTITDTITELAEAECEASDRVQKVRNVKNVGFVDENHLGEDREERSSANTFSAAIVIHLLVCLAQYFSCVYSY